MEVLVEIEDDEEASVQCGALMTELQRHEEHEDAMKIAVATNTRFGSHAPANGGIVPASVGRERAVDGEPLSDKDQRPISEAGK